jgi:hypothetical protein
VTDCNDADKSRPAVDGIDDPKPPDAVPAQSFQFPAERVAAVGIDAQSAKSGLDALLQVGREMADHLGDMGRDIDLKALLTGHAASRA